MQVGSSDVLALIGTALGAWLLYKGVRYTATSSLRGVERATEVDEQQSALEAWKELNEPLRTRNRELGEELADIRRELRAEREDRIAKERRDEHERAEAKRKVDDQIAALTERIDLLTMQLGEWKRLAKTIARWASRLRDEVLRLGGTVPATPEELLTLQAIEDAEQS